MNDQEAKEFLNDVIAIKFPSIMNWIEKNSLDPKKTRESWRKTLQDVEADEALWYANQMLIGEIKLAAYEYDQFPAKLRTTCLERRAKLRESQRQNLFLSEMQASKNQKKSLINDLGLTHYVSALIEIKSRIIQKRLPASDRVSRFADAEREVLSCHSKGIPVRQEHIESF
jgi:hypothetical protein